MVGWQSEKEKRELTRTSAAAPPDELSIYRSHMKAVLIIVCITLHRLLTLISTDPTTEPDETPRLIGTSG